LVGLHDPLKEVMQMGRRSEFSPAQKRDAVLAVLTKRKTVSEVCREMGVSETSFVRWREKALTGMEQALADKAEHSNREARLEAELAETQRALGKVTLENELRGKALRDWT
jgi:transposase-like protein